MYYQIICIRHFVKIFTLVIYQDVTFIVTLIVLINYQLKCNTTIKYMPYLTCIIEIYIVILQKIKIQDFSEYLKNSKSILRIKRLTID